MPLNIRDPRAAILARDLANRCGISMTKAVISALEAAIEREQRRAPLAVRVAAIANDLAAHSRSPGRQLSRDEIDDLWGA